LLCWSVSHGNKQTTRKCGTTRLELEPERTAGVEKQQHGTHVYNSCSSASAAGISIRQSHDHHMKHVITGWGGGGEGESVGIKSIWTSDMSISSRRLPPYLSVISEQIASFSLVPNFRWPGKKRLFHVGPPVTPPGKRVTAGLGIECAASSTGFRLRVWRPRGAPLPRRLGGSGRPGLTARHSSERDKHWILWKMPSIGIRVPGGTLGGRGQFWARRQRSGERTRKPQPPTLVNCRRRR
jgi:hypothetical protein